MSGALTAGLIQLTADRDLAPNLATLAELVRDAAGQGATLILTPENATMMEPTRALALAKARPEQDHPALPFFRDLARETGAWLLAGSLTVKSPRGGLLNRSYLFSDRGEVVAAYTKIHLFDVDLPGGESYRESASFEPGDRAVVAPTPWGPLGLSICYDLRFPQLYRALAQAGARLLAVPAAFTQVTGAAHWRVLLQARAIETGCFVLAPAQTGAHAGGRLTFGHSLAVSPWGEVLADGGVDPGVTLVELDLAAVDEARRRIPSLTHDRPFAPPFPAAAAADRAGVSPLAADRVARGGVSPGAVGRAAS